MPEMLNFLNVSRQPASESDPLIIDKYMQHNQFSVGQFVLRAGADKGKQHVRRDTMVMERVQIYLHPTLSLLSFYCTKNNVSKNVHCGNLKQVTYVLPKRLNCQNTSEKNLQKITSIRRLPLISALRADGTIDVEFK